MPEIIQVVGKYGGRMYLDSICITNKNNMYCIRSHGIGVGCPDNTHGENNRTGGEGRMKMEGKKRVLTVLGKVVGEEVKRREAAINAAEKNVRFIASMF